MLIKNSRLRKRDGLWNISIKNGRIDKISQKALPDDPECIDAAGHLTAAPYVEPHIHLDAVFTAGEPHWNESGTLFEGIELWAERKKQITADDVKQRARKAIQLQISHGIQFIRSHVDTTDPKLTALKALLEIKKEVSGLVDLQLVAFPQEGICSYPGGYSLLEEAVKLGADVVGAIPHYEFTREDGLESLKKVFELAQKYDRLIDVHCDEIDDPQSHFLETVAATAYKSGMCDRVSASHTTAMHSYNNPYARKLFRLLHLSGINIISCPTENIHLQGRFDNFPKRRGITRVKELLEAGINTAAAQDSIMDPWYPLGTGNPLREVDMCIHLCQMMGYKEIFRSFDLVTDNAAHALHLADKYGIEENKPANIIIIDADNEFEAIRNLSPVLYSIRHGKIILERTPQKVKMKSI